MTGLDAPAGRSRGHGSSRLVLGMLLPILLWVLWACGPAPLRFEQISFERAEALLAAGAIPAVEVVAEKEVRAEPGLRTLQRPSGWARSTPRPGPTTGVRDGRMLWVLADASEGAAAPPPHLPEGPLLIVSADQMLAERAAGALLRSRNGSISVFISANAEDRQRLYALASPIPEPPADTDGSGNSGAERPGESPSEQESNDGRDS